MNIETSVVLVEVDVMVVPFCRTKYEALPKHRSLGDYQRQVKLFVGTALNLCCRRVGYCLNTHLEHCLWWQPMDATQAEWRLHIAHG